MVDDAQQTDWVKNLGRQNKIMPEDYAALLDAVNKQVFPIIANKHEFSLNDNQMRSVMNAAQGYAALKVLEKISDYPSHKQSDGQCHILEALLDSFKVNGVVLSAQSIMKATDTAIENWEKTSAAIKR